MEKNIIQEKLKTLHPYLRVIMYDPTAELYVRLHVMIPKVWSYKSLIESGLVLNVDVQPESHILVIGLDHKKSKDFAIDELLDAFAEVIDFNQKEEKKRKLLLKKMKQLQMMSLEDIENLSLPKIDESDVEDDISLTAPTETVNYTYVDPMLELLKKAYPQPVVKQQPDQAPVDESQFTPLYQNVGKPMIMDAPVHVPAPDGLQYTPLEKAEKIMFSGNDLEFIPDDPNDPENDRRLKEEYYRRQQERAYGQQRPQQIRDDFPLERDPME